MNWTGPHGPKPRTGETKRASACLLALLSLAALVSANGTAAALSDTSRAQSTPNILIIVTDDQRAGTLDVMPATRRWFKRGGTSFKNAFATTPLCCPSRASIFTGQYAHNHGVRRNPSGWKLDQRSTIQRYLKQEGYRNAIFGKYLQGVPTEFNPPYFDTWSVFPRSRSAYRNGTWNVDGRLRIIPRYATRYISRRSRGFLEASESLDQQPWFLVLTPPAPHLPYTPQPKYAGTPVPHWDPNPAVLEEDRSDKPPFVQERSVPLHRARKVRAKQLRTLMSVDDMVKRVFSKLRVLEERRNTLAFFLSDNGYLWGEHGLGGSVYAKRPPYTGSVRIPLLARWRGHFLRNESDSRLVANIDIAPTIADAVGVKPDPEYPMDGKSLLGTGSRDHLLLEYFLDVGSTPDWAAFRSRNEAYVEYYLADGLTPTFREYYSLAEDPWQLENLLGNGDPDDDPQFQELSRQLDEDRRCSGNDCP
jgi:arylsulfatase A-like enzyme